MQEEITQTIGILNKALEELPGLGSQAFELMIHGQRVSGAVDLVVAVLIVLINIFLWFVHYKLSKRNEEQRSWELEKFLDKLTTIIVCAAPITLIFFVIAIHTGLMSLFAPGYVIIKGLIGG